MARQAAWGGSAYFCRALREFIYFCRKPTSPVFGTYKPVTLLCVQPLCTGVGIAVPQQSFLHRAHCTFYSCKRVVAFSIYVGSLKHKALCVNAPGKDAGSHNFFLS